MPDIDQETATFVRRTNCVACDSSNLITLDSGCFADEPVRSFIETAYWGVQPMPFIERARWELVRCNECEQMFHRNILSPEWQERRFAEWMGREAMDAFARSRGYDNQEANFRASQERMQHMLRIERMTRTLRGIGRVRLLDFGCGDGELLAQASLCGFEAYGLDRDEHRRRQNPRIHPSLASLDDALDGLMFHAVTLIEVLEHLDEPMVVLGLIRQRMELGGILIVEVPNCHGVTSIRSQSDFDLLHPLDHINTYTPDSLQRTVERAGFRRINRPSAFVTTDPVRVIRTMVKDKITRYIKPMTRLYFRMTG